MYYLLAVLLLLTGVAAWAGDGPVPVDQTRIIVAPFCGLSRDPAQAQQTLGEIKQYCNAVYHAPWLFLYRLPSGKDVPNELDPAEINHDLEMTAQAGLPCILTLHWGPTGQPDMMEWIAKKYEPSQVWQVNIDGSLARHASDPFANLVCLAHPNVRYEIEDTYKKAVATARAHRGFKYVLALGGTTEPMVARGDLTKIPDNQAAGFCFNPEHIKWWRGYLAKKWKSIDEFNSVFDTSYKSFDEVEPPKSLEPSPLFAEYERGLRASLIDYETWQMQLMHKLEPNLPLLNHIASVLAIVSGGVRSSYTTYDSGSAAPGVPGGSVYTVPDHIADYAAIQMDGHRSFNRDEFAAIELGILGTWDGRGEEYKVWYSQMAARFGKIWSAPYAWNGGGSNLRESDAKEAFPWATKLGTLDAGKSRLPSVALLTNHWAWSWDCSRARGAELECYKKLFEAGIDRVIVSEMQVEDGWLERNDIKAIVLADPFVLSRATLSRLRDAQLKGAAVVIAGVMPERDEYGRPLNDPALYGLKKDPKTIIVDGPAVLPDKLISRLKLTNCQPGLEIMETDRGYCVVNVAHCVGANRVTQAPEKRMVKLSVDGKTREIPVQYFTFVEHKTGKVSWIDEKGEWHTEK